MDPLVKKNELGARIAEAGFNLFRQYGVRAITLDEIALQLGISKKTIYEHFTGKNELVTEIIRQRINQIQDQFMAMTARSGDAIEANMLMIQFLNGIFRNMNPIVLMDLQKYHPEGYRIYHEHMYGFVLEAMRKNITRGIAEGLYRADTNIEIMAYYRVESCNMCFKPGMFPKDHFEMSRVQKELLEHFIFGIATEKGYKLMMEYREKILNKKD
jgi:AcrR family transcriptional regulator